MAAVAGMANEKDAYVLSDRATFLALKEKLSLQIVSEGDEALLNRYSLILVNAAKFPKINAEGARVFFDYLLSKQAKKLIVKFGVEKFGKPLFTYDYKAR